MKATPGPWERGTNGESGKNLAICSGHQCIAVVYGFGYPIGKGYHPQSEANANLIVAAPALRDALEKLLALEQTSEAFTLQGAREVRTAARAALALCEPANGEPGA